MAGVRLSGVSKKFGPLEVIKGIDLEIDDGEFVVLVGPSGCGKSTLLNLIAGLETLSAGDIMIGGRAVNAVPPRDRDIAMVFQSYALYPTKSVRGNITFGMKARHIDSAAQDAAVDEIAQLLHIDQLLERKPGQLSGGQRQRVAMGRALVRKPDVFLFDEPLSNLDAKLRIEMRTEIKKLHRRLGKTTIYVTHDQIEAMTLASRIAVMDNGHIRQYGTPNEIYEEPVDLFVAEFMGSPSMNIVSGRISRGEKTEVIVADDEGEVRFPLPSAVADHINPSSGRDIVVGMRPEIVTHQGGHASSARTFTFTRHIDLVEPTGPDTMLVFTLGGKEVIARVRPDSELQEGQPYRFEVNMDKVKLFDPETGKRL